MMDGRPTPEVTVLVVNYNAGARLRTCLDSAIADLDGLDWSAVVVDNASEDATLADLTGWSPRLTIVRNTTNRGFGAAMNQAAKLTAAPLMWLLNPDCEVRAGAFAALKQTMVRHPICAVAAPQLLNADGTTQESARGEPTAWTGVFGRHGLLTRVFPNSPAARRNLRARTLVDENAESTEIDWAMAACWLMSREAFDAVGGFDERFFLYWEDADLCRRLRERGYVIRFVPGAKVIHAGGQSSRTAHAMATRAFHRSAYLYYATHVVRSRWHPARWFAWSALRLRAWWRTRALAP
jgi:GT2 family glycosyltransferase